MGNQSILLAGLFVAVTALAVLVIILMIKISRGGAGGIGNEAELRCEIREEMRRSRQEMSETVQLSVRQMGEMIAQNQRESTENQSRRLAELNRQLASTSMGIEQRLENIRISMEKKITMMTDENNRQLSEMRNTVDEKLQKTLEDRIGRSFRQVSDTLEQVTRGLGQMQTLAAGVGDSEKSSFKCEDKRHSRRDTAWRDTGADTFPGTVRRERRCEGRQRASGICSKIPW